MKLQAAHAFSLSGWVATVLLAFHVTPAEQEILSHMSIVYLDDGAGGLAKTIRFSGVNVQLVNGLEATNGNPSDPGSATITTTNGLGNLIVGYNELTGDLRTGSHNVVVGPYHSFSGFGGAVIGRDHTSSAAYASVTGGISNRASGTYSAIDPPRRSNSPRRKPSSTDRPMDPPTTEAHLLAAWFFQPPAIEDASPPRRVQFCSPPLIDE